MASVFKRRLKGGGFSYHARYRDGAGKARFEKCQNYAAAKARVAEIELELARSQGRWVPPSKVTVAEYSEQWLAARGPSLRPATRAEYERILEVELLPRFGSLPLAALSRSQLKAYAAVQDAVPHL